MLSSWWARQGSNLRPTGYEPAALPLSYGPSRQLYSIVGGEGSSTVALIDRLNSIVFLKGVLNLRKGELNLEWRAK